jgi:hypothetical protein
MEIRLPVSSDPVGRLLQSSGECVKLGPRVDHHAPDHRITLVIGASHVASRHCSTGLHQKPEIVFGKLDAHVQYSEQGYELGRSGLSRIIGSGIADIPKFLNWEPS